MKKFLKSLSFLLTVAMLLTILSVSLMAAGEADSLLGNDNVRKPSEAGALQVIEIDGQMTLADAQGRKIQLRGMSTHGLQWFGEIINENAFVSLSEDWEANVIRLAMYIGENGYAKNPEMKDLVYQGIEYALENDMYVIVDWHVLSPGDPNAEIYAEAFNFFDELSDYYKDNPKFHYILWEICNEPSPNSSGGEGLTNDEAGWQAVKSYAEPIVAMLREKGDNIILVGNPNWSQRPDLAADDPIDAENIMYSLHFYTGTHMSSEDSTDRGNVMSNARYALEHGVAIFATEWGTSEATGNGGPYLDKADQWIDFMNTNNVSWCNWSLTNKNETSGSFMPYIMGVSEATVLDPGDDRIWTAEEMSVTGEFIRARIKGIEYEPIDRKLEGAFEEVLWTFDDGTTQGFELNRDSPVKSVTLENRKNVLWLTGMKSSNDTSDTEFWNNVRISSEGYSPDFDIFGGDTVKMDIYVEEPTTISISSVPQSDSHGWTNPKNALRILPREFTDQGNGLYMAKAVLMIGQATNIQEIASDADGSILTNIVLFVGSENGGDVGIDNITFSGSGASGLPPLEHQIKGDPKLPSDFDDFTRQGWDWNTDSGTKVSIKVEAANRSLALCYEFAYPEIKPTDNWASAPRLDLWIDPLIRNNYDYVVFDLYLKPTKATTGEMAISCAFQPPEIGYWVQIPESYNIDFTKLSEAELTEDGLYHFFVTLDFAAIESITEDMPLRNMILIFGDIESDFAGKVYMDNVKFLTQEELDALTAPAATPVPTQAPTVIPEPTTKEETPDKSKYDWVEPTIWVAAGVLLMTGGVIYTLRKKKKAAIAAAQKQGEQQSPEENSERK
jgi:endoglucanase